MRLRTLVVAVVVVLLLAVLAVGGSAALDTPSRTATAETIIDAPRELVWDVLMDFDAYPDWNPLMTSVQGTAAVGQTLDIHLTPPGGPERDLHAKVFVFKPPRKLRWQSRMLVPGLRDLEYEVIVAPLGPSRAQVVQRARYEGLLVPVTDTGSTGAGLESLAVALERRVQESR
jgi:hypothetical protein